MGWPPFDPVLAALRGGARSDEKLAAWIEERYGTPVVQIVADTVVNGGRLAVWVRTREEADTFRDASGNYDAARQRAVADRAGRPDDLVIFTDADRVLRERTLTAVGDSRLTDARAVLDDPRAVWKIYGLLGRVFVFVHTDAQRDALRGSAELTRLIDELWRLTQERDEFGVFPRQTFEPSLDSKQNLDENFEGNSYYYHL